LHTPTPFGPRATNNATHFSLRATNIATHFVGTKMANDRLARLTRIHRVLSDDQGAAGLPGIK
jgi:hypothetical protein